MTHPTYTTQPDTTHADHEVVDQLSPRYGVAARDIFSDAGWTPVEMVRARDWHDTGTGTIVQSSETAFD